MIGRPGVETRFVVDVIAWQTQYLLGVFVFAETDGAGWFLVVEALHEQSPLQLGCFVKTSIVVILVF